MMRDNNVYDQLERVIRNATGSYLDGYGVSQVPKLVNAILFAFDVVPTDKHSVVSPVRKKHRPCSCGSQFQIFTTEKKDEWLFICDNENTCCEVVSMRIKAKTPEDAWLVWDKGASGGGPCHKCGKGGSEYYCRRCSFKETLGKAMDRAEQKIQEENTKQRPNCGQRPQNTTGVVPPRSGTFTFADNECYDITEEDFNKSLNDSRLKECAQALVNKLNLIEKDGRCAGIFVFAANYGCTYTGPDYGQELIELERLLND